MSLKDRINDDMSKLLDIRGTGRRLRQQLWQDLGPSLNKSASPSFAATYTACDSQ